MEENQAETQRFSFGRPLESVRGEVGGEREERPSTGEEKRREGEATGRIIEANIEANKEEQTWAAKELKRLAKAGYIVQVLDVFSDGTVIVLYEVWPAEEFPSPEEAEKERKEMARLVAAGLVFEYRGGEGRRRYFVDKERAPEFENLQEALRWVDERASERRGEVAIRFLEWLKANDCMLKKGPINPVDLRVKRWGITGPRHAVNALREGRNQGLYIEGLSKEELRELIVETAGPGETSLILTQAGEGAIVKAIGKAGQGTFKGIFEGTFEGTFDSYPEEIIPVPRVRKAQE